jgi:hypothetical protein
MLRRYLGPRTSTPAHFAGGAAAAHHPPLPATLDEVDENEPSSDGNLPEMLWEFDSMEEVRSRHPEHIDVVSQVYSSL